MTQKEENVNELSDAEKDKMYLKAIKDCYKSIQAYIDKIRDKRQAENYMSCVALNTYSNVLMKKSGHWKTIKTNLKIA